MPPKSVLDLSLPLAHAITLTRGPRSHLATLMDAAILIRDLEPFRQTRPAWDRAAGLILLAATTRTRADVAEATRQLLVCVERENWWKPERQRA
jgi:glutamine amidotransferase PdxT